MILRGIERLRQENYAALDGKRVGLMTNPGAVDRDLVSTYEIMTTTPHVNLTALFGPEHGMFAAALDAVAVDHAIDPHTGAPIYSLYGETYRPTNDMLENIDVLVCDIQDVGVRFYTFLWTISYILETCGENGVDVMILDRPNPIGDRVSGRGLERKFSSFVGRFDIPMRHGMTLGELAQMMNAKWNPTPANVSVIECGGWNRSMLWDGTDLEFVPTSPAMTRFVTALHYPGACLLEGTKLSEGRGTTLPFEVVGGPYINGEDLAKQLNAKGIPGVRFRPHAFYPTSSKFRDMTCYGVQLHITDQQAFEPIHAWLSVIIEIHNTYPDDFEWLPPYQTEYERGGVYHFDRLIGSSEPREMIDAGATVADVMQGWQEYCDDFRSERSAYLIESYSG